MNITNPDLKIKVQPENQLKKIFINYVGDKLKPEDGNITVEMAVEVLSQEFPEFLMVLAEENFIRGYEQALSDLEQEPVQKKKKKK